MVRQCTLGALAAVIVAGGAMAGCKHADDGSKRTADPVDETVEPPPEPSPAPRERPRTEVVIKPAGGGDDARVFVEVVRDRRSIRRGLMYRQHLPPDQGMLFLMEEEKIHTFWMKNTLIALDILFIKRDKTVAGVVENVEPMTKEQRYVDQPSLYVLEVNAGWSRQHGVGTGARVEFVGVDE